MQNKFSAGIEPIPSGHFGRLDPKPTIRPERATARTQLKSHTSTHKSYHKPHFFKGLDDTYS